MQKLLCYLCNLSKWHHWTRLLQVPQTTFCKSQLVKSIVHRSRQSRSSHHRDSGKNTVSFFSSDVYVINVLVKKRHNGTHVKYWLYYTVKIISTDFCVCVYFIGVLATNMDCIFDSFPIITFVRNYEITTVTLVIWAICSQCMPMCCKYFMECYTAL